MELKLETAKMGKGNMRPVERLIELTKTNFEHGSFILNLAYKKDEGRKRECGWKIK